MLRYGQYENIDCVEEYYLSRGYSKTVEDVGNCFICGENTLFQMCYMKVSSKGNTQNAWVHYSTEVIDMIRVWKNGKLYTDDVVCDNCFGVYKKEREEKKRLAEEESQLMASLAREEAQRQYEVKKKEVDDKYAAALATSFFKKFGADGIMVKDVIAVCQHQNGWRVENSKGEVFNFQPGDYVYKKATKEKYPEMPWFQYLSI